VNQLLSKIDGVDSLNNILLIGMTNRMDMIDDALLRPGRLELHVEIGLPDEKGRNQILGIHTKSMADAGRVNPDVLARMPSIAAESKNFSGAELEGLVRTASSYALTRAVDPNDLSKAPDISQLQVVYEDFQRALGECDPKFGVKTMQLEEFYRCGMIDYGNAFQQVSNNINRVVQQMKTSEKTPLLTMLLEGEPGEAVERESRRGAI